MNLVQFYRDGGICATDGDVCRSRGSGEGCPCTDTADRLEALEEELRAAQEMISYLAASF